MEQALKGGATLLQLREKNKSTREYIGLAEKVHAIAKRYNVPLIIDDRVDVALATHAEGVHVGAEDMPIATARKLMGNDKINDAAVIGLPDERLGEIAAAIISVKEDCHLSEQEVNDFCKGLPRYKRPRKIIFAEVPRNPTGKIEKPRLREMYAGANLVEQQTKK